MTWSTVDQESTAHKELRHLLQDHHQPSTQKKHQLRKKKGPRRELVKPEKLAAGNPTVGQSRY